jgi:hypothetical protein
MGVVKAADLKIAVFLYSAYGSLWETDVSEESAIWMIRLEEVFQ